MISRKISIAKNFLNFQELDEFEKILDQHKSWVQQSIKNITEDSTNEKALYLTHDDICQSFEGETLLAIQAPNGTQLEVPIPEQQDNLGKRKYQIHLKSTDGQIYVMLVNKDPDSDHPVAVQVPPPKEIADALEKVSSTDSEDRELGQKTKSTSTYSDPNL